jgi:hypothetical protein
MNKPFFDISKEIANDFLQSIIFIDDNAYIEKVGNPRDFDALEISKYFSLSEKFCSIFRPTKEEDIDNIIKIAKKADVVIVDWEMNFTQELIANDLDDEVSVDDTDVRGSHTKKILKELLSDPENGKNSLKLMIIYTGTTDLPGITNEIKQHLEVDNFINLNSQRAEKNCCLFTENIRIQVVYKGDPESSKFTHNPELKEQEVTIANLPNFVLTEFTKLTNGLLSNFALKTLTEIRRNSHRILSLFSKDIDSAYLAHQSLLPNVDGSNELLVELIKDTIRDLLRNANLNKFIDENFIKSWISANISTVEKPCLNGDGNPLPGKNYTRNNILLQQLLFSKNPDIEERFEETFERAYTQQLSNKEKPKHLKFIIKNNIELFMPESSLEQDIINQKFAILTHHKNFFSPLIPPTLSLGTVVYSTNGTYFICIQQRCDSMRISTIRRFLFLSLTEVDNAKNFDFITPAGIKLKLDRKSYNLRTIKFDGAIEGVIQAKREEDEYFFFPMHYKLTTDEKLKWIFELKDLHAQRIAANYCAELSRVGLDESEWLRLNQK